MHCALSVRDNVRGAEVTSLAVGPYPGAEISVAEIFLQPFLHYQDVGALTAELDEGSPEIVDVPVYVHVVCVHGRDYGTFGMQPQEGAVELIGLGDHQPAVGEQEVGAVVAGNASEEGGAAFSRDCEDVGQHGAGRSFSVGAGYCQAAVSVCNLLKGLRALDGAVTAAAGVGQLSHFRRDGRGVDDQGVLLRRGQEGGIVLEMNRDALLLQCLGDGRGCAVVAADPAAGVMVPAGEGAHADAADTDKVDVIVCLHVYSRL